MEPAGGRLPPMTSCLPDVRCGLHAEDGVCVARANLEPLVRINLPEFTHRATNRDGYRRRGGVVCLDEEGFLERPRKDVRIQCATDFGRTAWREIRRGEIQIGAYACANDIGHMDDLVTVIPQRRR